jgi:hypothetical protein
MRILLATIFICLTAFSLTCSPAVYNLPQEFRLSIRGSYGCIAAVPYFLAIEQRGEVIVVTGQKEKETFRKNISIAEFEKFWKRFVALKHADLKEKYGFSLCTADFRGILATEYLIDGVRFRKEISFVKGEIADTRFKRLYNLIMKFVDAEYRLP